MDTSTSTQSRPSILVESGMDIDVPIHPLAMFPPPQALSESPTQLAPRATPHKKRPRSSSVRKHQKVLKSRIEALARLRVAASMLNSTPVAKGQERKRRTCRKCGILECPGSQRVANCRNPCHDCHQVNCPGRNSKRPNKTCREGWY